VKMFTTYERAVRGIKYVKGLSSQEDDHDWRRKNGIKFAITFKIKSHEKRLSPFQYEQLTNIQLGRKDYH
jgi:hypothetical protein